MSYPNVNLDGHDVSLSPENLAKIGQQVKEQIPNMTFAEALKMGAALLALRQTLIP